MRLVATANIDIQPNTTHTIAYVPSGFEPPITIPIPLMVNAFCKGIAFITTGGDIQIVVNEAIGKDANIRFNTCYIR